MPRAFTDSERYAIRARLEDAGRELFARRGIRATTVEQLARAAGISKGAFYLFYPSKEALFFALMERLRQPVAAGGNGFGLFLRFTGHAHLPLVAARCNPGAP